ncbi:MAG: DUF4082 domain-containing protein [Caldilineaceae bacterium]|nr:DUF4082 domain-containing protein [Caldilineaceae bacterium]
MYSWKARTGLLLAALLFSASLFPGSVLAQDPCADLSGANAIVRENCEAGTSPAEWDISGAGDPELQGFATDISVNQGQTIHFKVDTSYAAFKIDIYRMGYYGGNGARLVDTIASSATNAQNQPACASDPATGLVDCGNWSESASWAVPADATSGIYFAKLVREGGDSDGSHIVFIVRADDGASEMLFQTADTTWQAYNRYGGNSLYSGSPAGRAYKVSYNRPFTTRDYASEDWVFNAEYPMVRWLERNGYDVSYFAGVDADRYGAEILEHDLFLSVGHDEYWSGPQRAHVEAARDAGVHLAFFSGNEIFWKTRWEESIDGSNTPHRTLVSYKETKATESIDPTEIWTGTWRDPRDFNPEGANPENALTGQIFTVNSGSVSLGVPAADGKMRFWRNTDVANLSDGQEWSSASNAIVGYEWDEPLDNGSRPDGLFYLSTRTANGVEKLQDYGNTYASGSATHHLSMYRHSSGALVFGAGTVQWSWGLDSNHDRGSTPADANMQQATVNLFADMGVQPGSLQSNLVAATASTDTTAPTSSITAPADGANVQGLVTVSGSAVDAGGGLVGGVEVSVDGGATWHPAEGRESWSYSWTPTTLDPLNIRSRAVDDSGNLESPGAGINVTVAPRTCPCSIWEGSSTPASANEIDNQPIEVGVKFQTGLDGYITALRFYKGEQNTGTHVGHLWDRAGSLLAEATFAGESASGWQEVTLGSPVAVAANTTYIASYHSSSGHYAVTDGGLTSAIANPPVRALADGEDGPNGLYKYGIAGFPSESFQASNYWVDVLFTTNVGPDMTPPTVASITPAAGATNVAANSNVSAVFNEPLKPESVSAATVELRDAANALVDATVSYNAATRTIVMDPAASLASLSSYTALLKGGAGGIQDAAGNVLEAEYTWSFTTASPPAPPPNEGPGGPILVIADASNPFTRYYAELLRAEGLNAFTVSDISLITAPILDSYEVVLLGEMALDGAAVTMLTDWVTAGGNLIAMRPDPDLAGLLGLNAPSGTLNEGYLLVNTAAAPGAGIVNETIQFHGSADLYTLNGATAVATLYSNATASTPNPAVTLRSVGANGGQAAAFTFDLARSVIYTRQGNPAWAGQERDGVGPIRSNDMFFGGSDPDWINLDKVAIPQADEAQRLLANLIGFMNADQTPLPRFWYFPRGEKAVVVMTHDDHGSGSTVARINSYNTASPAGCNVDNWECVRSSTYLFTGAQISDSQLAAFQAQGHEFVAHVNTGCSDFSLASLQDNYTSQLASFASTFPSAATPLTQRTHCIAFSDWASQPKVQLENGMRLDTNYYYWPESWIQNRPGMFTGSGMPMRFADLDGTLIDVYQATTQMTDESGQSFPFNIDTLLNRALGPEGYYGAFVANMHTDGGSNANNGAAAIVSSAQTHDVPVISAVQLLTWVDGRNASSFANLAFANDTLTFDVDANSAANGLWAMVPAQNQGKSLAAITQGGNAVPFTVATVKGVSYAQFAATSGSYVAQYGDDSTPPTVTVVSPADGATSVAINTTVTAAFSEEIDPLTLTAATFELRDASNLIPATVSYNAGTSIATLTPSAPLAINTQYTARLVGGAVKDSAGNALALDYSWSFTTNSSASGCPCSFWDDTTLPGTKTNESFPTELGVKFRSSSAGYITGIRFYKGAANSGTFVGNLWSANGELLATTTFAIGTVPGWQQALFETPVAVTADTTYVASYFTPSGNYSYEWNYFATEFNKPPLTVLQNGGVFDDSGTSTFPTKTYNASNYWVDVIFDTVVAADTTPPVISTVAATVDSGASATITWATNEPATSRVDYGTAADALDQNVTGATLVTAHSLALSGLTPNTTYYYRVTSADAAANSANAPETPNSFTTLGTVFADSSAADFSAGTVGTLCYVAEMDNGELILAPALGTEFNGTALPNGWTSNPWSGGGSATVAGGALAVDGVVAQSVDFTPGRALEFVATFQAVGFQTAGFGGGASTFNDKPWAVFGTGQRGDQLYARSWPESASTWIDIGLGSSYLGSPHLYRIEWKTDSIRFYIDGIEVGSQPHTIAGPMRVGLSDYNVGGGNVSVEWVRVSPYATACSFESRIFDAGAPVAWNTLSWTGETPAGTTLSLSYRTGDTPIPDGSWTAFAPVATSGDSLSGSTRYIQYRAALAATNADWTPVLRDVTIAYSVNTDTTAPSIVQRTPLPDATDVAPDTNITVVFDEPLNAATLNATTVRLRADGAGSDVAATVSYDAGTNTATLDPTDSLQGGTLYHVTVAGTVADVNGNALGTDASWSFTTVTLAATLNGSLTLQGRADHAALAGDVTVALYAVGEAATPLATYTPVVNSDGSFSIAGITPGTYQVAVKHAQYLQRVQTLTLNTGSNTAAFGELLAGDAFNDNFIDALDVTGLAVAYNTQLGDGAYNAAADFNDDQVIDALDLTWLALNYNVAGEMPTTIP